MSLAIGIYCGEFSFCAKCEKCVCRRFIKGIENWFLPMSHQQKLAFFLGLLKRCNTTLTGCLLSSVKVSEGKEKIYRFSKTNPQLDEMTEPPLHNAAMQDFNLSMINVFLEFLTFSDYQKKMVFLHFFKLSEDRLLATLASQMYNIILRDGIPDQFSGSESSSDSESAGEEPTEPAVAALKIEKEKVNLDDLHDAEPLSNYESEDDGFAVEEEADVSTLRSSSTPKVSPRASSAKGKKKRQAKISIFNENSGKDFISALPIGIAKRVFGYLDKASITNCLCVSSVWRQLAEEVRTELHVQAEVTESVKLMQGSTGQLCNHRYARFVDVLVPNFDVDTGAVIPDPIPKQIDENSHIYVTAFNGISTRKVIMEERNGYCGPFNVMVVHDQTDKYRVIHNDGGNLIVTGSRNRKITLHDITTGQELEKVLDGHSGSVRCIRISTSDNLVFSGSYDTGVRVWDLNTGRFTKVFNGHQATVLCLAYENQLIVSGSVDRTCRVWSLKSLKCIRKLYHRSAVTAVAIRTAYLEERIVSGDVKGHIKVWNLRTGRLIKVLHGHSAEVTCLDIDRWFIISGSKDNYVMGWSNQGDHKRCLFAFAHPNHVFSVSLRYLRAISGCGDGRIRIWSILNGNCVKVLRGNSRNDAIISMDCRDNMVTINTESNVIVMKFETVKYNYTTSELYLPDSSLKAKNAMAIAVSDSELDHLDSNGNKLGGGDWRPHSAVRATRMHLLQCASREISGSRASVRSISPAASKSKSRSRSRTPSPDTPRRAASSMSFLQRRAPSSQSTLRPNSSPSQRRGRNRRRFDKKFREATFLQDPQELTSMLDHRCYPLRHRDLEAARRIQAAAIMPPWRKDEADVIIDEVHKEHKRLVDKRRMIREQRAEHKRLAILAEIERKRQMALDSASDTGEEDAAQKQSAEVAKAKAEEDMKMIRRMTWSFHRAHVTSASTYSSATPLNETEGDDDEERPIAVPAPQPPPLNATQLELRKTLLPGANPPALPFVRVSVSQTMRENREEIVTVPPVRVVPIPPSGITFRHNSLSNSEKSILLTPQKEKKHGKTPPAEELDPRQLQQQSSKRQISSAQKLRKILLEHKKETELAARRGSVRLAGAYHHEEVEISPADRAALEKTRLLEMAAKIEQGGWDESAVIKTVEKNPVTVCMKPSPVPQTVFQESVTTSIPKPFEIVTKRAVSAKQASQIGQQQQQRVIYSASSKPSTCSDPLMKVANFGLILENTRLRAESIKNDHVKVAQRRADAQLDYRFLNNNSAEKPGEKQEESRPSTAATSAILLGAASGGLVGPKPLVLHNPDVYDRQTAEIYERNAQDVERKRKRLDTWRRKRWALLATGKLTPNELHIRVGP